MPLLEVPKVLKVTATVTLDKHTAETLDKYAAFINAVADDVINRALQFVFEKDKEFTQFLRSDAATAVSHSLRIKKAHPIAMGKGVVEQRQMLLQWRMNSLNDCIVRGGGNTNSGRCFASEKKLTLHPSQGAAERPRAL